MKKELDKFSHESILTEVNAQIEKELLEELENPDKQESKIKGRISIFEWIMFILLGSLVLMKIILVLLSYLR